MFNKSKSEKILPQIKLKYYSQGGDEIRYPELECYLCQKRNIIIGSAFNDSSGDLKPVCEECTIDEYQKQYNLKSKEIARARRRRNFDITYLFNEMLTDKYLKDEKLKSIDDLSEEDTINIIESGKKYYNELFSKKEKIKLEETVDQSEIEKIFQKKLEKLSLDN
jgi:hypothetical protein